MSEKVLGFYKKDALRKGTVNDLKKGTCQSYEISKNKTFPVRLASESVDLERLRKYCKEEIRRCYGDSELDQVEIDTLTKIQEWAEKEAKKQAGEKK